MSKPRVLVIGAGSIGERHLRCFAATGRAEMWVCETHGELRERIGRSYPVARSFADLSEVAGQPPEIAVVCTPAHLHLPMSIELAERGVHLLIEKPLGTSLDGVDRLRQLVAQHQLTAAVAYVLRMNPLLHEMRTELLSGRFGEPVELIFQSGQHFPFYRPAYREIYYADRTTGGGAIQDGLTHGINLGQWLVGPVTRVVADAGHLVLEGVKVEDTVHVLARHGDVMAAYSLNQHQAPNESTVTVVCRNGTVRCELHRQRWCWQVAPDADWTEAASVSLQRDDLFVAQANAFLDAVEGRCPPACDLDEGLQTLRVNLALLRSVESSAWQELDGVSA